MHEQQLSIENTGQTTQNDLSRHGGQDLPVEIWTEILGYLPRGIAWKLIGVNRFLFQLGMDEIYEEIMFTDCDRRGLNVFEQVRHPSIAARVRRLLIRPSFLPGIDPDGNLVDEEYYKSDYSKSVSSLLEAALSSIPTCSHLDEVTIVLYDHSLTPSFISFLKGLLKQLAKRIKILRIDVTPHSFLSINNILPALLPSLVSLNIRLCISRVLSWKRRTSGMTKALSTLVTSGRSTLQALVVDVVTDFDISVLFGTLPALPSLRVVELRTEIAFDQLSNPKAFTSFLQRNADHLERLAIGPSTIKMPNTYRSASTLSYFMEGLFTLRASNLKELYLNMDRFLNMFVVVAISGAYNGSFAPNLKKLVLEGSFSFMGGGWYKTIMNNEPPCGKGALLLEVLEVRVPRFAPEYLELFAFLFPNLRCLDVQYCNVTHTAALSDEDDSVEDLAYECFATRRYPKWKLQNIRVTRTDDCPQGPMDIRLIEAIASGLPSLDHACRPSSCESSCQDPARWDT